MLKKPPRVRDNNGALQVRLRLAGRDHFINRIGRFDDPVAQARGQAICAEIWRDAQQGDLDLSLNRYRPLVEGRDQDLLDALRRLSEEKRQARVTHAYRVVKRFGLPIRTRAEVDCFLAWMKAEGRRLRHHRISNGDDSLNGPSYPRRKLNVFNSFF